MERSIGFGVGLVLGADGFLVGVDFRVVSAHIEASLSQDTDFAFSYELAGVSDNLDLNFFDLKFNRVRNTYRNRWTASSLGFCWVLLLRIRLDITVASVQVRAGPIPDYFVIGFLGSVFFCVHLVIIGLYSHSGVDRGRFRDELGVDSSCQ